MTGYTADEKLRLQQLRELRRRWLKDQELSPREPVLPPRKMWPLEGFWNNFLRDGAVWKKVAKPYGIVYTKPKIFPGDTILETGEVIPPMKDFPDQHH
ncbi:NADH dehydrogenase [ubiquinone] 1 beta subcomplex subunit 6 isoform X2 [Alexandromys fortis]|uniref:NADH dehydrogenase [ubiquinone] 1 beta subcomplex subunit 6 isoform X2 n=1 Tax=Alexandromys fortis TaxID=100897 RepID=UPI0021533847|nr:NADH dehydrogenase [ubiquinone] 1 beta subcomplex subunit 6 isoform X2 [Microtus fortis]